MKNYILKISYLLFVILLICTAIYTFIVLPADSKNAGLSLLDYKTPNVQYKTIQIWKETDGTQILKRLKI